MILTQHSDYGLRMLMYLAMSAPETASVTQVADALGVSSNHLMKVAQTLRREGIVIAHRGRSGGLELAHEAEQLSLGEVVRALESFTLVECFDEKRNQCVLTPACGLAGVLQEALDAFLGVLDRYTVADLVTQPRKMKRLIGL